MASPQWIGCCSGRPHENKMACSANASPKRHWYSECQGTWQSLMLLEKQHNLCPEFTKITHVQRGHRHISYA